MDEARAHDLRFIESKMRHASPKDRARLIELTQKLVNESPDTSRVRHKLIQAHKSGDDRAVEGFERQLHPEEVPD